MKPGRPLALALAALGLAPAAHAASRPAFGGNLTVAYAGPQVGNDPLTADAPGQAALLQLETSGLCRATAHGVRLELARGFHRPSPDTVVIDLAPGLKSRRGAPLSALDVATAWGRLFEHSPYRALFAPIRGGEAAVRGAAQGRDALSLPLAYPWPDLETSLCHPALAITVPGGFGVRSGVGPFLGGGGTLRASMAYSAGRPFLDRLKLDITDERGAARQFELGRAQLELGGEAGVSGPMRFATYLLFRPERVGPGFRESVDATVDRNNLVRLFVRAPAAPMPALIPGAAAPQQPLAGPAGAPRSISLLYDSSVDSQRPVAERIALELHDRGYDVRLTGLDRDTLRQRWASGDYDAMLQSVLLPAHAGPALAVALELAGRHDLLAKELPPIGAIADASARDAFALQRATALTDAGGAIPLFTQGVRLRVGKQVTGELLDLLGVPDLSQAFLALDGQLPPAGGP